MSHDRSSLQNNSVSLLDFGDDPQGSRFFIHSKGGFLNTLVRTAAPILGGIFGGPLGAAAGNILSGAIAPRPSAPQVASVMPTIVAAGRAAIPRITGAIGRGVRAVRGSRVGRGVAGVGGAAGAVATGAYIYDQFGNVIGRKGKKRAKGLSGRDIQGAQKVARVVQCFGYKPKMKYRCGKKGRCR